MVLNLLSVEGIEPPTLWFVAIRSNPLSYTLNSFKLLFLRVDDGN